MIQVLALYTSQTALTVNDGDINITESHEGLEALNLTVNGGNIRLIANDDGLNAAGGNDGSVTISGGTLYIQASGDGIDANGTLTDSKGNVLLTQTPELAYSLVILSSPDLVSGESYTLSYGTTTKTITAD